MEVGEPHILIVDNDPRVLMALSLALRQRGYVVRAASSAHDALQSVEHATPSLVLADACMPDMDGACFASALRQRGLVPHLVVMTEDGEAESWAERIGAADYLPKPFAVAELLNTVEPLAD